MALTDPAFLLAVLAWVLVLVFALGLCAAAAMGDRELERARPVHPNPPKDAA